VAVAGDADRCDVSLVDRLVVERLADRLGGSDVPQVRELDFPVVRRGRSVGVSRGFPPRPLPRPG